VEGTIASLREGKSTCGYAFRGRGDTGAEAEKRGAEQGDRKTQSPAKGWQSAPARDHEHEAQGEGTLRPDALDDEAATRRPEGRERDLGDEQRAVLRVGEPARPQHGRARREGDADQPLNERGQEHRRRRRRPRSHGR
jgi:hypothetical protein